MDGTRRYRRCDVWIARKNGKSTLGAGVGNYLLFADGEPGAEIYGVANDKSQAMVVFKEAANMVKVSPDLKEMSTTYSRSILVPETLASYQVLSSEAKNKDGLNIHGLLWDELHECRDPDLWEKLTTASGTRRQPLIFIMSTAGFDRTTIGYREYETDRKILDGTVRKDDRLVVIYEAAKKDDWKSPATWEKCNPSLGKALKLRELQSAFEDAQLEPAKEGTFKRYHLNVWTSNQTTWMDMDRWDECGAPVDAESLRGQKCWIGVDLSKRDDLTAIVAVFKIGEPGREIFPVLPMFFAPEDNVEKREKRDSVPYREYARQGVLRLTPGNVVDYDYIHRQICEWAKIFQVIEVPYDPYNAWQLAKKLEDAEINAFEFPQKAAHMSTPTKELRNLVLDRRIAHGGNPLLRWNADNAVVITDHQENQKITKKNSTKRVDGIVATIMGLGRAMLEESGSVYDTGGIFEI